VFCASESTRPISLDRPCAVIGMAGLGHLALQFAGRLGLPRSRRSRPTLSEGRRGPRASVPHDVQLLADLASPRIAMNVIIKQPANHSLDWTR